jgi:hypothetical protein
MTWHGASVPMPRQIGLSSPIFNSGNVSERILIWAGFTTPVFSHDGHVAAPVHTTRASSWALGSVANIKSVRPQHLDSLIQSCARYGTYTHPAAWSSSQKVESVKTQ